ncbi:MAG: hypothetical protein E6864_06660 [Peptoniphilus harei]|nr:hypothetical protein [Peptoniphilus harei]MDU1664092.1 hypothetical protein [Peptoniphilus harei]
MEIKDFSDKDQEEIKKGPPVAEIDDKEAAEKILALVPDEWIKKIPFLLENIQQLRQSKELLRNIQIFMLRQKNLENCLKRKEKNLEKLSQIFFDKKWKSII